MDEDVMLRRFVLWGLSDDAPSRDDDDSSCSDAASELEACDESAGDSGDQPAKPLPARRAKKRRLSGTRRRVYKNEFKLRIARLLKGGASSTRLAEVYNIHCPSSIHAWAKMESKLAAACNTKMMSKVSLGGQGRHPIFEHEDEIVQWIKDMRRDDYPLKTAHVVQLFKEEYSAWTTHYLARKREDSLHRLVRRLIYRHRFSFRQPTRTILSLENLLEEQVTFTENVVAGVNGTNPVGAILNADETAVYYSDNPGLIIAARGDSSKIKGKKQSYRATVVLTIAADGTKLMPLIIFRAQPGGSVEDSFDDYPEGPVYTVQANTWMDAKVWKDVFIGTLWEDFVYREERGPLALYVDNFKSHVSAKSMEALAQLGTEVVPLPTDTTSVLQPLDVGVMGPFKRRLRSLALADELSSVMAGPRRPLQERLLAMRSATADEKRRSIAEKVIRAWESISAERIRKAWIKSRLREAEQ